MTRKKITQVKKRDGRIVDFDQNKITSAIFKALTSTNGKGKKVAQKLSDQVVGLLKKRLRNGEIPEIEQIQDIVEEVLILNDYTETAKAYILYREQHRRIREAVTAIDESVDMVDQYIKEMDWQVKENANMGYSLQGLNHYVVSKVAKKYWLSKIYPKEIRQAVEDNSFHIHDLDCLACYCMGWDLYDILTKGFSGAKGKVESKPAKHFRTALGQLVNFFFTLQGEAAGAEAVSNFDTLLAPFIRYDNLNYSQVEQAMQEFLFNCAVPTRVGFQCLSEDTEILSQDGWKKYNQVKEKDIIATFNVEKGFIEYLPVKHIFAKKYKGKMYNLKNRISDQLISPEHRVVRKKFSAEGYVLEKIEKTIDLKSPFGVPVGSEGNINGNEKLDDDVIQLIAWTVSEGSIDKSGRGSGRISIYQSKKTNERDYLEIVSLCRSLGLKFTERSQKGLGEDCGVLRFDASSTRKILNYFVSTKDKGIKFIPESILKGGVEESRLFLETYLKGDGHDGCKITTTSEAIRDGLMQVAVNAGYGATVLVRKPDNKISKKDRYIIRLIRHKDTYINKVKKIDYQGAIWCPNTDNETVVARRNGKVFITGNTPFINVSLDITPSASFAKQPVIIGGEPQKETYGEFQEEMNILNRAFYKCLIDGDKNGRPFTFPIPTVSITKDFDWDNPSLDSMWEATAKYGINYFSNFIQSDMSPEDIRSMCCRLRLDNKELYRRGGGLFGANPLTGAIGVVTINLPRLGYLSKTRKEFFDRLAKTMDLAKESLEIKRKILEKFIEKGLYPYSRYYLEGVKKVRQQYFGNHFSTIGLVGMNECLLNFLGANIASQRGRKFTLEVLEFMRERILRYQKETDNLYNLEATPAEGTSYRLALKDKEEYPDIVTAGTRKAPFYTNSTQLPVNYTDDIFKALKLQDEIQTKYTGGVVMHLFLGERVSDTETVKSLIKRIFEKFRLPYITFTPTFSICPHHGYISGEHFICPKCVIEQPCEVYSRVVGYIRPVQQWHLGKQEEFSRRKMFKIRKRC